MFLAEGVARGWGTLAQLLAFCHVVWDVWTAMEERLGSMGDRIQALAQIPAAVFRTAAAAATGGFHIASGRHDLICLVGLLEGGSGCG